LSRPVRAGFYRKMYRLVVAHRRVTRLSRDDWVTSETALARFYAAKRYGIRLVPALSRPERDRRVCPGRSRRAFCSLLVLVGWTP
jgi:hypothetical protein